jgi:type I restriction enzyme S subunit
MTNLPEGWEIRRLEDLCEPGKQAIVDGPFGSNLKRSDYVDSGIPVLKIQNIKENLITLKKMDYVSPDKYQELVRHSFTEGDIVMTKLGDPLGVSAIVNGIPNGLIVADLVRIRPSKVLTKFLCYQLNSPRIQKYINEQQKGTTRPRVNLAMIRELPIYSPPIEEQHNIVELLEDHLSRLDAALADVNQGHKKIRQFRRSFLQETFIDGDGTRDCSLGDVVEIKTGKIDANKAVPDGRYPFFTCAREVSRIDDAPFNGKVVLVAGNGDLNVKYYEGKFNAYQRTYILKSKNEEILFPKYLFWFMEHYIFELRTLAIGTTIKYIKLGNLIDAKISLPSVNIQKQIVLEIERSLSFVEKSEETFTKLTRASKSLQRALLNSAFSGQLTNEVSHV